MLVILYKELFICYISNWLLLIFLRDLHENFPGAELSLKYWWDIPNRMGGRKNPGR